MISVKAKGDRYAVHVCTSISHCGKSNPDPYATYELIPGHGNLVKLREEDNSMKTCNSRWITVVCRVKRMTRRLKSDHGNSVVHPCSLREV